jgi:O-glycosyl hydrolase
MGNYSRFIRPGMQRINTTRSDNMDDLTASQHVMLSAYTSDQQITIVAINYIGEPKDISLDIKNFGKIKTFKKYLTSAAAGDNLKAYPLRSIKKAINLPARSVTTFVLEK